MTLSFLPAPSCSQPKPWTAGQDSKLLALLLLLGLCALGALLGTLVGQGAYPLAIGLLAVLIGPALLLVPTTLMTQCILWVTFVIQGSLIYFLNLSAANWLPYLLSLFVTIPLIGSLLTDKHAKQHVSAMLFFPAFTCVLLYLLCLLLSTALGRPPVGLMVAGLKTAVPIWLISLFLVVYCRDAQLRDKLWQAVSAIYLIQVPFVVYQHFVVAKMRTDSAPWDAVVGTFGGNMFAGGANASLVDYALWVLVYFTAQYTRQLISGAKLAGIIVAGLAIIFLGEVKASFFWLPLMMGIALRERIFRSIISFLSAIGICLVLFVALWTAYEALYWHNDTRGKDLSSRLETMTYFFDDKSIDKKSGEISRGASLSLWWQDRRLDTSERVIGFGSASSKVSATSGVGKVAARYFPLDIAATTASMLLWDAGFLGLLLFAAAIGLCGLYAWRLMRLPGLPPIESARLESLAILMVLFSTMLIYNRALVDEPSIQMMLAIAVGYVGYWHIRAGAFKSARTT